MVVPASPLRHGRDHLGTRRSRDVRWTEKRPTRPPRARASPCAASVRTPRFLRHRGLHTSVGKAEIVGRTTFARNALLYAFAVTIFAHEDLFSLFLYAFQFMRKRPLHKKQLPRASFGGARHHSPTLFASHRDVTQRSSKMVRADPTTVRGVRFPPLAEPSRRRSPPRRLRVARSRVAPLDFSRRRRQRLTGAPRLPRDRRKPSSPRLSSPSRRLTPMSTPSCRRRSSGRCASRLPRARTRRAAARSTRCRRVTRPISPISLIISRLACGIPRNDD